MPAIAAPSQVAEAQSEQAVEGRGSAPSLQVAENERARLDAADARDLRRHVLPHAAQEGADHREDEPAPGGEEPPRLRCREILLPHMRPVRLCRQGQIQPIVDDEKGTVGPAEEPNSAGLREQFA